MCTKRKEQTMYTDLNEEELELIKQVVVDRNDIEVLTEAEVQTLVDMYTVDYLNNDLF